MHVRRHNAGHAARWAKSQSGAVDPNVTRLGAPHGQTGKSCGIKIDEEVSRVNGFSSDRTRLMPVSNNLVISWAGKKGDHRRRPAENNAAVMAEKRAVIRAGTAANGMGHHPRNGAGRTGPNGSCGRGHSSSEIIVYPWWKREDSLNVNPVIHMKEIDAIT